MSASLDTCWICGERATRWVGVEWLTLGHSSSLLCDLHGEGAIQALRDIFGKAGKEVLNRVVVRDLINGTETEIVNGDNQSEAHKGTADQKQDSV